MTAARNHDDERTVCGYHSEFTELLQTVSGDLRWLIRIGYWMMGLMVTALLVSLSFAVPYWRDMNGTLHVVRTNQALNMARLERLEDSDRLNKVEHKEFRDCIQRILGRGIGTATDKDHGP